MRKLRVKRWMGRRKYFKRLHKLRLPEDLPCFDDKQYADFKDEVYWLIKDFNHEQTVFFAWLCAVRALPFLSVTRGFEYFKEDKQKHLMWIFHTIDVAISYTDTTVTDNLDSGCNIFTALNIACQARTINFDVTNPILAAAYAANAAFDAYALTRITVRPTFNYRPAFNYRRYSSYHYSTPFCTPSFHAKSLIENTVEAAGYTFKAADSVYYPLVEAYIYDYVDMDDYPCCDECLAACTAAFDAYAAANPDNILALMKNNIFNDINCIKANTLHRLNNDTSIYGDMWHNFLSDLRAIGCEYWAVHYENLFDNGFCIDRAELKLRLHVPLDIREKGAADVGLYLEGLEPEPASDYHLHATVV